MNKKPSYLPGGLSEHRWTYLLNRVNSEVKEKVKENLYSISFREYLISLLDGNNIELLKELEKMEREVAILRSDIDKIKEKIKVLK